MDFQSVYTHPSQKKPDIEVTLYNLKGKLFRSRNRDFSKSYKDMLCMYYLRLEAKSYLGNVRVKGIELVPSFLRRRS